MANFTVRNADMADLDAVLFVQSVVFPDYQERRVVFEERLRLYPKGFFVIEADGGIGGYLVSYPYRRPKPPSLDVLIGAIPSDGDGYYIHDLSLLPRMRGRGAAAAAVEAALAVAREGGFSVSGLIAVGGADVFWSHLGYAAVSDTATQSRFHVYGAGAVYMERSLPHC